MTAILIPTIRPMARFDAPRPPLDPAASSEPEGDRPPVCPVCQKRLVILASRSTRDASGALVRRHLWGCPRGHATADYGDGSFGPVQVLPDGE